MNKIEKDRTGETCTACHKGKLYPAGYMSLENNEGVKQGESGRAERRYKCDKCGEEFSAFGVHLIDSISSRSTSASGVAKSKE